MPQSIKFETTNATLDEGERDIQGKGVFHNILYQFLLIVLFPFLYSTSQHIPYQEIWMGPSGCRPVVSKSILPCQLRLRWILPRTCTCHRMFPSSLYPYYVTATTMSMVVPTMNRKSGRGLRAVVLYFMMLWLLVRVLLVAGVPPLALGLGGYDQEGGIEPSNTFIIADIGCFVGAGVTSYGIDH